MNNGRLHDSDVKDLDISSYICVSTDAACNAS